jgi:hypothetical protein
VTGWLWWPRGGLGCFYKVPTFLGVVKHVYNQSVFMFDAM